MKKNHSIVFVKWLKREGIYWEFVRGVNENNHIHFWMWDFKSYLRHMRKSHNMLHFVSAGFAWNLRGMSYEYWDYYDTKWRNYCKKHGIR